jgi:hypothetical protein
MAYADRLVIYVVRAPVLKLEVGGQMFFTAVGEVSSRLELLELARDHLPLLEKGEVEVKAEKPARLYDLLGNRLPSKTELRFAWFGFEVKEPAPERCVLVRFKITLRDGIWRRRRTIQAETAMEAFAAEALVWRDARGVRHVSFDSAKLKRWVPRLTSYLGPFYNFDALKKVMPVEPPVRFKVRKARRRSGGSADLRGFLA